MKSRELALLLGTSALSRLAQWLDWERPDEFPDVCQEEEEEK